MELSSDQIRRLLVATHFDLTENIWWRLEDVNEPYGPLNFYAKCSDFFMWGCADVEPIETEQDVILYEQALVDLQTAAEDTYPLWVSELYAARRRKLQPAKFMIYPESQYYLGDDIVGLFTPEEWRVPNPS